MSNGQFNETELFMMYERSKKENKVSIKLDDKDPGIVHLTQQLHDIATGIQQKPIEVGLKIDALAKIVIENQKFVSSLNMMMDDVYALKNPKGKLISIDGKNKENEGEPPDNK